MLLQVTTDVTSSDVLGKLVLSKQKWWGRRRLVGSPK